MSHEFACYPELNPNTTLFRPHPQEGVYFGLSKSTTQAACIVENLSFRNLQNHA